MTFDINAINPFTPENNRNISKYSFQKEGKRFYLRNVCGNLSKCAELGTLECDILNPDLLINLEIKFMRKTSNI